MDLTYTQNKAADYTIIIIKSPSSTILLCPCFVSIPISNIYFPSITKKHDASSYYTILAPASQKTPTPNNLPSPNTTPRHTHLPNSPNNQNPNRSQTTSSSSQSATPTKSPTQTLTAKTRSYKHTPKNTPVSHTKYSLFLSECSTLS